MARTLIRAHTVLTQSATNPTIQRGALIVEDGTVQQVGLLAVLEQQGPFDVVLGDPTRHIALPGLVNGHHHSLRPGKIALDASPLETWLIQLQGRELPPLSPEELYDHTLLGALRLLRSGVTAVIDHYPTDLRLEDFGVEAGVRAYADAGMRAAICISCADQHSYVYEDDETFLAGLPQELARALRAKQHIFDQDEFFARWERLASRFDWYDSRIRIGLAPLGPQWCSDELLSRICSTAEEHDQAPVQIHLLESKFQALYSYRRYKKSIVQHLADINFLRPGTSCAHCVWVNQDDVGLLADVSTIVIYNPCSNLLLFNGIAPVADLLNRGVRMGFGLDGTWLNDRMGMFADLRLGLLLQRESSWDRHKVTAADMLALATHGGADVVGMQTPVGRLQEGFAADVVLLDRRGLYDWPYVHPHIPAEEVLLERATAADVDYVLVSGKPVIEHGKSVGIDEVALQRRVARSLEHIYELLEAADRRTEILKPYVSAFYQCLETELGRLLAPNYQFNCR